MENKEKLQVLREHLGKLHQAWQDDPNRDGHCKMSEGYVGITCNYPYWHECNSLKEYVEAKPQITVQVYSYLFGPSRMHDFASLDEALAEVLTWGYTPDTPVAGGEK